MDWLDSIKWDRDGLVPVIAQEAGSGDVLMFAWMNREALAQTAARGQAVYWSRSRQRLWHKGEESGHFQQVHEIRTRLRQRRRAAEGDAARPRRRRIACHTGRHSCFFQRLEDGPLARGGAGAEGPRGDLPMNGNDTLARLAGVIEARRGGDPDKSYVARLFSKGTDAILKKVGEEATEVVHGRQGRRPPAHRRRDRRPVVPHAWWR